MGEARHWLRETFPAHFVAIVGAAVGLAALIAIAIALSRIRDRRIARYGLVVAAIVLAVTYSARSSIGNAESDVVEHVHFIEYGVVTWLFYRAWLPLGDGGVILLPLVAGLAVGTCEEWYQWFLPARVGELRDIFLNGAAIVSGLLLSVAMAPPPRFALRISRRSLSHVFAVSALLGVLLTGFLNSSTWATRLPIRTSGRFARSTARASSRRSRATASESGRRIRQSRGRRVCPAKTST